MRGSPHVSQRHLLVLLGSIKEDLGGIGGIWGNFKLEGIWRERGNATYLQS